MALRRSDLTHATQDQTGMTLARKCPKPSVLSIKMVGLRGALPGGGLSTAQKKALSLLGLDFFVAIVVDPSKSYQFRKCIYQISLQPSPWGFS